MSQSLLALNGGVEQVVTNSATDRETTLSPQYIIAKSLQSRPTEWVIPEGRPIYRRLPAISETYQIDFFNLVSPPNTAVAAELQDIGYIYVPWTENSEGPTSIYVSASDSREDLIIRGGKIVWKYGGTQVFPTLINPKNLQIRPGRYFLAYELIYNDDVEQKLYGVEDFALTGQPLTLSSSTDDIIGWRYPVVNAFLNTSTNFWTSKDTYFPSFAQPETSFLQWTSELGAAYSNITLRCPEGTGYSATASLYYVTTGGVELFQGTVSPSRDTLGQYYSFEIEGPAFNKGWKVVWSDPDMAIQSMTVSGTVTLERKPAAPATKAALVIYPQGTEPDNLTYCPLAYVEISNDFKITLIEDIRYVIRRDYVPVADWLTRPFDTDLIDLYAQVKQYPRFWMNPPTCMKQEYVDLAEENILIV
jgi:hypothetical protein